MVDVQTVTLNKLSKLRVPLPQLGPVLAEMKTLNGLWPISLSDEASALMIRDAHKRDLKPPFLVFRDFGEVAGGGMLNA